MQIKCLGGFREVGRNAVLVETDKRILLDYGIKVESGEIPLSIKNVDAMLLSHPHLDHCGMVPTIKAPVFSTAACLDQARLLLRDSIKVSKLKNQPERFSERDVEKMEEFRITYGQQFDIGNTLVDVYDAGHVPGSAGFLLDYKKRIFYTGDFNLNSTELLNPARFDIKNIDVLITECTYSYKDHPPREEVEKQLIKIIGETIVKDGIVLIPSFAVGRSAEILMTLNKYKIKYPIYLDGMAKEALNITLRYPELLRDYKLLKKAAENVIPLYSQKDRKMALERPCIIVTTAGMLSGGPVISFLKKLYNKTNSSLVFVGFQAPETPGKTVLDEHRYKENDLNLKIDMNIQYLDFSSHAGRTELLEFIKKTNPEKLVLMHGERCEEFAEEVKEKFGIDTVAPESGDVVDI